MTTPVVASIRLMVNGDPREVTPGLTVGGLLRDLRLDPRLVVVELNREILRDRTQLDARVLNDGDVVELVHFVGGG